MERSGTVDKALQVLEALRQAEAPQSLAALSANLGMPKATLHRLLGSLARHDLVEQAAAGRYALGVGLMRLGLAAQATDPFIRASRGELELEVERFNETFFLVGARAGRLFVLDKVEGTGLLRAAPNVGTEVPVETTASGRLYLGLSPGTLRESAETRAVSKAGIERAVRQGYDLNQGEWIAGLTVVAAPVIALSRMFGTIACGGAASQLSGARLEEAVRRTRGLAARIASVLAGRRGETREPKREARAALRGKKNDAGTKARERTEEAP